jgi:hypothetical protein
MIFFSLNKSPRPGFFQVRFHLGSMIYRDLWSASTLGLLFSRRSGTGSSKTARYPILHLFALIESVIQIRLEHTTTQDHGGTSIQFLFWLDSYD